MAPTIKEIKEEISKLRKIKNNDLYLTIPEYVEAKQAMEEAQNKMGKIVAKNYYKIQKKEDEIKTKITELENQIKDRNKTEVVVPKNIEDWFFNVYCAGSSYGYGDNKKILSFTWISEDQKYAIITKKGGSNWIGRGTMGYGPARHWIIRIFWMPEVQQKHEFYPVEGRLTKALKEKMITYSEKSLRNSWES